MFRGRMGRWRGIHQSEQRGMAILRPRMVFWHCFFFRRPQPTGNGHFHDGSLYWYCLLWDMGFDQSDDQSQGEPRCLQGRLCQIQIRIWIRWLLQPRWMVHRQRWSPNLKLRHPWKLAKPIHLAGLRQEIQPRFCRHRGPCRRGWMDSRFAIGG